MDRSSCLSVVLGTFNRKRRNSFPMAKQNLAIHTNLLIKTHEATQHVIDKLRLDGMAKICCYFYVLTWARFLLTRAPRFIKDDYLQQNSFTKYDKYCPFYKSVEMMRNICTFHNAATSAVEKTASGNAEGQKITLNIIKQRMGDVLYKVTSQKFEDPGKELGFRVYGYPSPRWGARDLGLFRS